MAAHGFKAILVSCTAFVALACAAAPAAAQTAAADEQDSGPIIVTGSRVVRDGYQAPTPRSVLTLEEIQNTSPTNNIADFINQQPALAGSTRPSNSRLNISSGQAGINALNLRNFGETRTLILIDGRRSVPSTITGVVDVNTIPQMLVERVDIVTGGASASYGSDAVAGVVNFILDSDFTGLRIDADTGITRYGDGFNYSFGVAGGLSFAEGRGHLVVAGEINHRDGIFEVGTREWNQRGFIRIPDPTWTAASTNPQFLVRTQVGAVNSTPGGLILGSTGASVTRLRGIYFGAGGQRLQFQYGALTFAPVAGNAVPSLTQGGDWQVNDSGRRIGLDPEDDRRSLFARLSFEVADSVTIFAEGSYNWQEVLFNAGPNLAACTTISPANIGAAGANGLCTLAPDNAFLIQAVGTAALTGLTAIGIGTTAADLPFRGINNRREVQRYVLGAEGGFGLFGNEARWNVYGQYGRADLREQLRNIMNFQRTANAVDAVFSIPGNTASPIACRINVDANPNNNDPNCVPLNRLGIGVASQAAINYSLGDPYRDQVIQQAVIGGNLSFTPFATWGGDVSMAIGFEYRDERIRGFVPQEFQPLSTVVGGQPLSVNRWSVGNYLPSFGSYNVKEAYLEAVVPLGLGLEFNGAVRATDYSTTGYVTTWRAGATWQPIEDIRLRITRSRDVRAPNLNELFAAGTANSDSVSNPFFNAATGVAAPLNGVSYNATSISYSGISTGNLNLQPERANAWNIGGAVTPRFFPGFSASVDYFRIDLENAIDFLSAQQVVNLCFQGEAANCAQISQDPLNPTTRILIRTQPFNFQRRLVRGIDFEASYRTPLSRIFPSAQGNFTLRGVATHYIENIVDTGIASALVFNTAGMNGGQFSTPSWIYRVSATYDSPLGSLTAVARGVSSGRYLANNIECQAGGCPAGRTAAEALARPTTDDNTVSGTFYVDLNATMRFSALGRGDGEFFINVTNVLDADPLLLPETGLAANSTYSDLLGRTFRVGFRMRLR